MNGHPAAAAFLCHPYHRGGVTRWMVDAAAELMSRGVPTWFVAPEPRRPFASGRNRATIASLVRSIGADQRATLISPNVGTPFELGTRGYRTAVYADAASSSVPPGTPIIVSDDNDVWAAAATLSHAYPMIGVLHADEDKYYRLADSHKSQLAACVAVSRRIARKAESLTGLHVEVVPCGVPMREAPPTAELGDAPRKIVWIGRVEEHQKRISDLPLIASELKRRGVRFILDVIGDGPERVWLAQQIAIRDLQQCVQLSGWLDTEAIWERLCASDVLVLPSNYEGMPVVVMEALSAGCAIVASRVSGVEDIAEDALAAHVVRAHEIGDVDRAATEVQYALSIPVAERRVRARQVAERLFSISVCMDRYQSAMRNLYPRSDVALPARPRAFSAAISIPLAYARSARRTFSDMSQRELRTG